MFCQNWSTPTVGTEVGVGGTRVGVGGAGVAVGDGIGTGVAVGTPGVGRGGSGVGLGLEGTGATQAIREIARLRRMIRVRYR